MIYAGQSLISGKILQQNRLTIAGMPVQRSRQKRSGLAEQEMFTVIL
jgi:hypothetical protein